VASTNPPISYQWQFKGTNLIGRTNDILAISDVQSANIGEYTAIVSDNLGSLLTDVANLSLLDPLPPGVTTFPASEVGVNTATLNGAGLPNGGATTALFEYGSDTSYGSSTPEMSLGYGANPITASTVVSGRIASSASGAPRT
jgi:hypothetical protein